MSRSSSRVAGGPVPLQFGAFIAGSIGLLGVARPIAKSHLHTPAELKSGVDALVGKRALVLERVDAHNGQVKIGGEIWTARAYMEDQVLEPWGVGRRREDPGATALVYGTSRS